MVMMNSIIEEFKNLSITQQTIEEANFLRNIENTKISNIDKLNLLSIPSSYLKTISLYQQEICSDLLTKNDQIFKEVNNEVKLTFLTTQKTIDKKDFIDFYIKSCNRNDLQYKMILRPFLIEYGLVNKSAVPLNGVRKELKKIKLYSEQNNLDGICRMLKALTNFDYINFNNQEKEILLEIMKRNQPFIVEIMPQIVVENKINYGSWGDFWRTVSDYDFVNKEETNTIINAKHWCINSDYWDERIDMSFFPHLPTVYDADDFTDTKTFLNSIDWSQEFYDYELDFILAANMDNYNKKQYKEIKNRIKSIKEHFSAE